MTENQTTKERLLLFIKSLEMSSGEFERVCGFSNGYVNNMRKGLKMDKVEKIALKFPQLNPTWLVMGEGSMLRTDGDLDAEPQPDTVTDDERIDGYPVPLLPVRAQAGTLNDFVASMRASDCEQVSSPIRGVDFAMTVHGDSMAPAIPSGAKLLIKRIDDKAFIEWGKDYVLDTCNGSVFKRLMPSESEDEVVCISNNPAFPPFSVRRADIYGIYRVLMVMTQY